MTGTVTDYAIVNGKSNIELVKLVGGMLGKGWQPVGGATFAVDEKNNSVLMQTLIRSGSNRPQENPRRRIVKA
jgi:hypothetical protein